MHSLSGIMHHNPAETSFDYTNLFRVGEKLNIPYDDKVQFFRTMLFNLIFGNRDDHSRNFSYLMDKDGAWRGAPAYDLTFTTNKHHQLMFDYKNGYRLKKRDIEKIATTFGIKNSTEIIEQMIDVKQTFLSDLATQYDMKSWYDSIIKSTDYVLK
ncbi:MAG: HipA domain-containing protein [Sulfurimonas sp.]|nr:HipA domain-containing protein [Sulfurimonas sp.]